MVWHLRVGTRPLLRARAFSAALILTLAVAVGGSTVVFGTVQALLFRPLPYAHPETLAVTTPELMWPMFRAIAEQATTVELVAGYAERAANVSVGGQAVRVRIADVTPEFIRVSGVRAVFGRTFLAEDFTGRVQDVVLLTDQFWRRYFGGSRNVVGTALVMDGRSRTIVGVLPPGFGTTRSIEIGRGVSFDQTTALVVPLTGNPSRAPADGTDRVGRTYHALVRLRQDVPLETARREIAALAMANRPAGYAGIVGLVPLPQALAGSWPGQLGMLAWGVGLLLVVGCFNAANLALARLEGRRREMALRLALGASPARLSRDVLQELVLLGICSAGLGSGFAWAGMLVVRLVAGSALTNIGALRLDPAAVAFAALLSILAVSLIAGVPALRLRRLDISPVLRLQSAGAVRHGPTAASVMVVGQVTFAVVLVVVGSLLARDLRDLQTVDLGFRAEGVLTAEVSLNPQFRDSQTRDVFLRLVGGAQHLPDVASASIAHAAPQCVIYRGARVAVDGSREEWVWEKVMTEHYFSVLSIPLLAGRDFSEDDGPRAPLVAIVNRSLAEKYWPSPTAAVGSSMDVRGVPHRVIGVVADARDGGVEEDHPRRVYLSYRQQRIPFAQMTLLLRSRSGETASLSEPLTALARHVVPEHPLYNVLSLEHIVGAKWARQGMISGMMAIFALLALVVAGLGVHGALSYAVAARTHDIGICRAIGGPDRRILAQVVGEGMALVGLGSLFGLLVAFGLRSLVTSQLVGGAGMDALTCALALAVVGGVGLTASLGPAWRAVRVDPLDALREQ